MPNRLITTIITLCSMFASLSWGAVIDAPHNLDNGIRCGTCHTYSTWWQYPSAPADDPAYRARASIICLSCHDENGTDPMMKSHNSTNLGEAHGIWITECIDCHDPHTQPQLTWRTLNPDELFLVSGQINTITNPDGTLSYDYTNNNDNTCIINIDQTITQAQPSWTDPALWGHKNDNTNFNRGLTFVHGTIDAYNTYNIISATASSITIRGIFDPAGVDPSQDTTFGLIYGQLIRNTIMAASVSDPLTKTAKSVKFYDPNKLYTQGGFTDQNTPRQGICQVCHLGTSHWTEDGVNDGHNSGTACTNCHLRNQGFQPTGDGHLNGTFAWENSCAGCHNPDGIADIINDIHLSGGTNSCTICHLNASGGALDPTTSAINTVVGNLPHLCSECHVDSYSQHHATAKAQAGDCTWCHDDPRQMWQTTFGVTGSMPRQLACRECHIKPDGTGLTVYKLDFPVTPSDIITFAGGDLSLPPENAKAAIQTIMDGSNGTVNHQINGSAKIDIYNFGTCFACHDGLTASAVNVWHARPKYAEMPADNSTNAYSMHFDTLRYAPGRSKFNLWRGDGYQNEPYFSHPNNFYDNGDIDAATRGTDFFDVQNGRYFITWNWGAVSDPYVMTQIPCFRNNGLSNDSEGLCGDNSSAANELIPVFSNGPTRDTITITRANYLNSTLSIETTNSNGDLSITYDDTDYGPMTGSSNSAWSIAIPLTTMTKTTVDIITNNPLGTNIINYPICLDPINISSAKWDSKNDNTLTVLADNINGANATLTVQNYNGTDYPMQNIGGNQWQLILTGVPFQTNLTINGNCDTVTGQVTDLTDAITITMAEWDPANIGGELTVWAENTSAPAILMADYGILTDIPMTWDAANSRWQLTLAASDYAPFVRVHSDYFGDASLSVVSLGELIIFAQAHYDSLDNTISVLAINEQGISSNLFANYNGVSYPMTNVGGNRWELNGQVVAAYLDSINIWSIGGGNLTTLVSECATPTWPPASAGTFLNAGIYWNRTDFEPDQLQVNVYVGQDASVPKMVLNGGNTPVEYPCIHTEQQLPGVYQCEVNDNSLAGAGYGPWIVVYSGSYPGDASVINYPITDWNQDQSNIQSSNIAASGLPSCPALGWDTITSSSAIWDGMDLIISASNTWQDITQMQGEYLASNYPLSWDSGTSLWSATVNSVQFDPAVLFTSVAGGYQSETVVDLTSAPDTISITDAGWNADNAGSLTAQVSNTFGNLVVLSATYNGTSTPMTWIGSNWQLQNITSTTLPPDLTITSDAPAGGTATLSPVQDRTPAPYPPACNSGNGMDKIISPLDKAHFDPSKNNELHVKIKNSINLSYGAKTYMTYSETADGQTRYEIPWSKDFTFEFQVSGFTWNQGAMVTIWSVNDSNEIMDVACDQPVMHKDLLDSITITRADWQPDTGSLTIWAENSATTTQLYLDFDTHIAQAMTWSSTNNRWELTITGTHYFNQVRVYSDANGDTTTSVLDLYPDNITVTEAYWKLDTSQGDLFIRADNSQGQSNQLYADFGSQTNLPMAWDIEGGFWKLLMTQVDFSTTVRIWSKRPGEAINTVTDLSSTHTLVTADSQCLTCHPSTDILFTIHLAKCDTCHNSADPVVQNAVNSGQGGSCTTCHFPISTRVRMTEVSFNFPGSNAIAMKDHNRPNSNILVPVPEYLLDTRNEPAAYAKDSPITIQAVFKADPDLSSAMVGSSLFAPQLVSFTGGVSSPVTFSLPTSVSQGIGVKTLTLDWFYCDENGTNTPDCATPQMMHDSHHILFITHNAPTAAAPFFTELVEYSTKWSADSTTEQEIVDNIYDGIWTLGAHGYKYEYPFLARTGTRIGDILRYQAGACGEWAAFLQRALEVQGVDVYVVDIIPDQLNNMVTITDAIGNGQETYLFGDHAFVVYGVPYIQSVVPTLGTAYDPSFHHTGPGWGGYEDKMFPYMEENDEWFPNSGYGNGPADDVLDTKIREVTDDFIVDESQL